MLLFHLFTRFAKDLNIEIMNLVATIRLVKTNIILNQIFRIGNFIADLILPKLIGCFFNLFGH